MDALEFVTDITVIQALCLIAGIILVIVEMMHPGITLPGILGGILIVLGIILTAKTFIQALILILAILAILGVALTIVFHSATKGKLSRKLILSHSEEKESGYIGTEDLAFFLGREGKALTVLRPSGTADFDGVRLDVVSQGEFLQEGTKVKIIEVEGRRIVVKEMK